MNSLLAEDSHETSSLIFLRKIKVIKVLFAAILLSSFRVKKIKLFASLIFSRLHNMI